MSPPPAKSVSAHSSSSSHSSFTADSSESSSTQSSSSTSGASTKDNGNATRNSGQNASSRNNSSSNSTQNSSGSSQSQQSGSTTQAQSANAASSGKNSAPQSGAAPGPSFLQALVQTQADAQDSASVTVSATPEAATGKGKGKTTKDDSSTSEASFGFLSQSLVAAMAGIQQPSPAQGATDSDNSVDDVSLSSGASAQSLVANLVENTGEDLKVAGGGGDKPGDSSTAATTATTDAVASAASTFQSHLAVNTPSQTPATRETGNTQVNTPVGQSGFADEVGDKITWMAHEGIQSASLQMTPEHMGPVEVKISMQDGSATVSINAAHADTRAALEQALPRLREMFSTQGLNLTDASVSQQFSRGQQPQKQTNTGVGPVGGVSNESASAVVSVTAARLGLVDTYA